MSCRRPLPMLAVVVVVWAGFVLASAERRVDRIKVRVDAYLNSAPVLIAKAEGFFDQEGLEVEYVRLDAAAAIIPALVRGDLDVLPTAVSPALLNAIARGARIKLVADRTHVGGSPACTPFALVASPALAGSGALNNPLRLRGLRLGSFQTFTVQYFLEKALPDGITLGDLNIVDVPEFVQFKAFNDGRIDLANVAEPGLSHLLASGKAVVWKRAQDVIPDFQFSVVAYGPSFLDQEHDAARRFMIAYLRAVRQYNLGKTDRNLDVLAAETGFDREQLKQACWPAVHSDGAINVASVLQFQDWAVAKGLVDKAAAGPDIWDGRFVEYANRALVGRR